MTTAALYARISEDDSHQEKGVQRQLEDSRRLAKNRGWDVVEEYCDNDLSAYSGKKRPAYEKLMQDVAAGRFEKIVIYHPSRLWRRRIERIAGIDLLQQNHMGVVCTDGPELDFTTAYSRSMAVIMGEMDTMESELKAARVARAALQRAEEGRASGAVSFGWQREYEDFRHGRKIFRDVEDPAAANVVREIVDRTLAGESLASICRDLNERNQPTPGGGRKWAHTSVRKLAMRPANISLRTHHGKVIGPAAWPAIVDEDKHERVTALLKAPQRRKTRDGRRKHLLTFGIGECGVCARPLSARVAYMGAVAGKRRVYRCDGRDRSCVSRDADKVDALVQETILEHLARPEIVGVFDGNESAATEARSRAGGIRSRLDNAADQFAEGAIDGQQLARITARLRPELEAAEDEARRYRAPALPADIDGLHGPNAAAEWAKLSVTARRTVLTALGVKVTIMPRQKSGVGFERSDIVITL